MIPSSFIHRNGGSPFPPATNKAPMMSTANAAFDSSLEMIMAGVSVPSPATAVMVPPPPSFSRIIASKRYYSSEALSDESTTTAGALMSDGCFNKDTGIQQQSSSSSSCNRRDSLLTALTLGSSAKPCPKEANDLFLKQNDLKQQIQKCLKKRKRRVCFAELATCYPPSIHAVNGSSCITPQEQESYWYSRQDLGELKLSAKRSCQGLNLDLALNKVYNSLANNHHDDDDDNTNTNSTIVMAARDLLQLQHFEMQRGLERWSSRFQMFSRCVTIIQAKTEVMLEQVNQQLNRKRDPEQLRQVVQPSSRKSARYARLLGLVDAHAAGMASLTTTNPVDTDDDDDENEKSTVIR